MGRRRWGREGDTCALHPSDQPCTLGTCTRPPRLVKGVLPSEQRDGGRAARQQRGDEIKMSDAFGSRAPGPEPSERCQLCPENSIRLCTLAAAPVEEAGGCPHRGGGEAGDDGDAHNGGIHVLMPFAPRSSACCACRCNGRLSTCQYRRG
ncbi:hypothetical protein fugu_008311 [Takifugu bimaculatus]|uniref:Uncharacterized protein n=1 Tax=Takifugu bimaculatus TaxID=433685 RepID=A0A4Z2B566_9TELE|nr:hypothetical protein fugu_008311 [Takifugu bimaculatus]